MSNLIIFFLPAFLGIILVIIGMEYQNYILGLLGSFVLLSYGVAVFIEPIGTLSSLMNDILGSTFLGSGAYLFLVGSMEKISEILNVQTN